MTNENETMSMPALQLDDAEMDARSRKPRGTTRGLEPALLTLQQKYNWQNIDIARLIDVSPGAMTYLFKKCEKDGVQQLTEATESSIVRSLFVVIPGDVAATLEKINAFRRHLTPEDLEVLKAEASQKSAEADANSTRTPGSLAGPAPSAARPSWQPRKVIDIGSLARNQFEAAAHSLSNLSALLNNISDSDPRTAEQRKAALNAARADAKFQQTLLEIATAVLPPNQAVWLAFAKDQDATDAVEQRIDEGIVSYKSGYRLAKIAPTPENIERKKTGRKELSRAMANEELRSEMSAPRSFAPAPQREEELA